MALTKQFSGNLYDKDGVAITQIRFRGYHEPTDTWSDWYDSDIEDQYNCNLGDAQWLTQTGITAPGDDVMIMFETKDVDPLDRQFCLYEFKLTSGSTYVQDVQLMLCQPPNVVGLWDVSSDTDGSDTFTIDSSDVYIGRVNGLITATTNFNDMYQWDFNGVTLKHIQNKYGQDIFEDRLSVDTVQFDWTESNTWDTPNTHTYTEISLDDPGYNLIAVKAINQKGQEVIDVKKIQIRYNEPIPDLTWTPNVPTVNDTLTILADIKDDDTRVTSIDYIFDGVTVVTNNDLNYSWVQDLGTLYQSEHTVNSNLTWNDGFTTRSIIYQEIINMGNIPPSFTITQEVIGDSDENDVKYTLTDLDDPDGENGSIEIKWIIEFKTPFDNQYKTVYNPGYPVDINQDPKEWIFTLVGDYRITAVAKDTFGLETSVTVESSFLSSTSCTGFGNIDLNNDAWQLLAIPVDDKTIGDYFVARVDAAIKEYDSTKSASDVIEVCSAYPGHINKFLSYIPGFTEASSIHNFSLVMADSGGIKEITGFWIRVKNYYPITGGESIVVPWDQKD